MKNNLSPLRYPGGKTRACKILYKIIEENFDISDIKTIVSPFFGGGSFEFFLQNQINCNIIANDKFYPLYCFWNECLNNKQNLVNKLTEKHNEGISKEDFFKFRNKIAVLPTTGDIDNSYLYFIINRCSFSGASLSGGFSKEASKKRFTLSSITKIKNLDLELFEMYNKDFDEFLNSINFTNYHLIFLDPPYYLENSKLYGKNGDMHENFNHMQLYKFLESNKKLKWIMTYNNCDYIKSLYKDFKIIDVDWNYGMNKTKKSSEIVIINN